MFDFYPLLPFLLLTGGALVAMLLTVLVSDARRVAYFALGTLGATALATTSWWAHYPHVSKILFGGAVTIDAFSCFFNVLFCMIGAVCIGMSLPYLDREREQHGEYYTLMLFSLVGMSVMVSSNDLITLFLGFETMSLAVYVLVGYRRHVLKSNEAILKYFFLGSFAAGIFLYGIAMIYGTAHTVNLAALRFALANSPALASQPLFVLGALMVLVAIAFKIAAFPFHQWLPDVYEGAPTPVTAFMATAVKAAAFALAIRLFTTLFATGDLHAIGLAVVWYLAILTMFVGNIFALAQRNLKRMLAYSSVAHTGYLLVGVAALPDADAGAAIMFYLVGYAFTNLGALACASFLESRGEGLTQIDDYAGAAWRYPLVGLAMAVCMFSLIGFPPTVGFFGKYFLFVAALKANLVPLVVVAIINSILSVYYYLRVVVVMFMRPELAARPSETLTTASKLVLAYVTVAVIWSGVGPVSLGGLLPGVSPLLDSARASLAELVRLQGDASAHR